MIDIAKEQAEAGDRTGAQETLSQAQKLVDQTITHKWYRDCVLADVAETQAATGGIAQAQTVGRTITDENSRNRVLANVAVAQAKAQARKGDRAGARESFSQAVAAAQDLPEMDDYGKSRYEVLADIAKEQARAGDVEKALAVVQTITIANTRDWVLADIAETQAATGGIAQAVELAGTISDEDARTRVLVDIVVAEAKAHAREEDHARAQESFSQAVVEAQKLPESDIGVGARNRALADIANAQAKTGGVERAVAVAQTITDKEFGECVLADIANAQARTGGIARAQKVAQMITDEDSRNWVLADIAVAEAKGYAQKGDRTRARRSVSQAVTLAERVGDREVQDSLRARIAQAQAETRDFARAFALAQMIDNDRTKSFVLAAIAKEQLMNSGLQAR